MELTIKTYDLILTVVKVILWDIISYELPSTTSWRVKEM